MSVARYAFYDEQGCDVGEKVVLERVPFEITQLEERWASGSVDRQTCLAALHLHEVSGWSQRRIGLVLGVAAGTVCRRIRRAKAGLRRALGALEDCT